MALEVRACREADVASVLAIYSEYVTLPGDFTTFEEEVPSLLEMVQRWRKITGDGLPFLVACEAEGEEGEGEGGGSKHATDTEGKRGGAVVGYCYASSYRPRSAYRFTVESSVYVAAECRGRGLGRRLMEDLLGRLREGGTAGAAGGPATPGAPHVRPVHKVIAVLGDADSNPRSHALHVKLGFEPVGVQKEVGWKHGQWVDRLMMQLTL